MTFAATVLSRPTAAALAGALTLVAMLSAGCSGGSSTVPRGGGGPATATPAPTAVPLPASATASIPVGPAGVSASLGPVLGGYSSTITVPAASGAAAVAVTFSATQPGGTPAVQTVKRRARSIGGTSVAAVAFVTMTSSATVTLGAAPSFSFTLPAGSANLGQISYVALYDPTASPQAGWTTFEGPGTVNGTTITFTASSASVQLTAGVTYDLVLFTVASALPTPTPTASPTPTPVATAPPSHGTVVEYPVPSVDPLAITAGPDGNLWFTTTYDIGKITTSGTVTVYKIPNGFPNPQSIVTGPDGNLWFAESSGGKIGKITTSGVITEYPVPVPAHPQLNAIAVGSDGNLWFTVEDLDFSAQYQVERIGKITPAGAITEYPGPSYSVHLQGIAAGADGNLWFTQSNGYIGKITTAGVATQYGVPEQPNPGQIIPGPGGALWFSAQGIGDTGASAYGDVGFIDTSGKVTQFTFPQHYYGPGIATGPDGNLWLGELQGYNVAKMTPSGTLVEYAVPSHSHPLFVTAGPDGNVWFTTRGGTNSTLPGSIGKITP
jgi:streptogramin lyase